MEDSQIIDLYFERSEDAILETAKKYGRYCKSISNNILHNHDDALECVNDTYMRAWNAIPPTRPNSLPVFLGKITRHLALNKVEMTAAKKRGSGQKSLVLEEIKEAVPSSTSSDHLVDDMVLLDVFNRFLADLPMETRKVFMRRYWYFSSVKDIALDYGMSESKVKMTLLRTRKKLKQRLEEEDITI